MLPEMNKHPEEAKWFALWTRSRQEKVAAKTLDLLGVNHFLPLKTEAHQWSDRKQLVSKPLFSGYVFVHMDLKRENRLDVLKIPGIVGFVGNQAGPLAIADYEIEAVRTVLASGMDCAVLPILKEGDRVRVVRGALAGLEGLLVSLQSASRLVISVDMIKQSLAVAVSPHDVEPLPREVDRLKARDVA